jgi:hypothetical protein
MLAVGAPYAGVVATYTCATDCVCSGVSVVTTLKSVFDKDTGTSTAAGGGALPLTYNSARSNTTGALSWLVYDMLQLPYQFSPTSGFKPRGAANDASCGADTCCFFYINDDNALPYQGYRCYQLASAASAVASTYNCAARH